MPLVPPVSATYVECHFYCIVPSFDALCPCQDSCLTLSAVTTNTTNYLESNSTLMFQPGSHNLDSNISISNISMLKLYSNEPLATKIICKPFTIIHFIEVSTVVVSGIEFIACGNRSIIRTIHFELLDSILISERGSNTVKVVLPWNISDLNRDLLLLLHCCKA